VPETSIRNDRRFFAWNDLFSMPGMDTLLPP